MPGAAGFAFRGGPAPRRPMPSIAGALLMLLFIAASQAGAQSPQASLQTSAQAPEGASGRTAKRLALAHRHMVVAAHPLAAEAGRAVLNAGGNALDAAIATQLVLGVVEPQSSG